MSMFVILVPKILRVEVDDPNATSPRLHITHKKSVSFSATAPKIATNGAPNNANPPPAAAPSPTVSSKSTVSSVSSNVSHLLKPIQFLGPANPTPAAAQSQQPSNGTVVVNMNVPASQLPAGESAILGEEEIKDGAEKIEVDLAETNTLLSRVKTTLMKRRVAGSDLHVWEVNVIACLQPLLTKLGIANPVVVPDQFDDQYQITFIAQTNAEKILQAISDLGVGSEFGSVSIVPLETTRVTSQEKIDPQAKEQQASFVDSMTSRLLTERVLEHVDAGASFSFDFVTLVFLASALAGLGLVTNNAVVIVASMLISPLMGPIIAITFGVAVWDGRLFWKGIRSEFVGICMCILEGLIIGFIFAKWGGYFNFPTEQMKGSGLLSTLFVGLAFALLSGMAVGMSVLSDNKSGLVGVALSTSLLPPAVNAGVCWGYAAIGEQVDPDSRVSNDDFVEIGGYSLILVACNVVLISLGALIIFKIKEVAPIPGKSSFWKNLQNNANIFHEYQPPAENELLEAGPIVSPNLIEAVATNSVAPIRSSTIRGETLRLSQKELKAARTQTLFDLVKNRATESLRNVHIELPEMEHHKRN